MKTYSTPYSEHLSLIRYFLLTCMLFPVWGVAQESSQNQTQALLEKYVWEFTQAYAAIPQTKDKSTVLKFLSPKVKSTLFYFSISENVRLQESNYQGFEQYLEKLISKEGLELKYELQDVLLNQVNGDVGSVVVEINYEIKERDGFHAKGSETVSFAWKKIAGTWKIVHFSVTGIEDEKLRGTCLCEVYSSRDGQYVVRTTVPNGRSYDSFFLEFETRKKGGDTLIRTAFGDRYKFSSEGDVMTARDPYSSINTNEVFGRAKSVNGAILLIIQEDLHADRCSRLRISK